MTRSEKTGPPVYMYIDTESQYHLAICRVVYSDVRSTLSDYKSDIPILQNNAIADSAYLGSDCAQNDDITGQNVLRLSTE